MLALSKTKLKGKVNMSGRMSNVTRRARGGGALLKSRTVIQCVVKRKSVKAVGKSHFIKSCRCLHFHIVLLVRRTQQKDKACINTPLN